MFGRRRNKAERSQGSREGPANQQAPRQVPTIGERYIEGWAGRIGAVFLTMMMALAVILILGSSVIVMLFDLLVGGSYFYSLLQLFHEDPGWIGVTLSFAVTAFTTAVLFMASFMMRKSWSHYAAARDEKKASKGVSEKFGIRDRWELFYMAVAASGTSAFWLIATLVIVLFDTLLDVGGLTAYLMGSQYVAGIIPPGPQQSLAYWLVICMSSFCFTIVDVVFHWTISNFWAIVGTASKQIDKIWYKPVEESSDEEHSFGSAMPAPAYASENGSSGVFPTAG